MALYAFDGTWNTAKKEEDPQYKHTNVFRLYEAYGKHSGTDDLYVQGVGTRWDLVGRIIGGFFGAGELPRLDEAYQHLCKNWAKGDHVIDVVGFSRGAATTLDFCHRIQERGICQPGTDVVVEPTPEIRFLGVWDIVAAFGLANLGNTTLNVGHHLSLPKARLQYCFHAMALDERRPSFLPTRLKGAYEVWFRGVHSDIGGGNTNAGLNDITLKWMMSKAKAAKLPITDADIAVLKPDPTTAPHFDFKLPLEVRDVSAVDRVHYTVATLDGCTNPPSTCSIETEADEQTARELGATLDIAISSEALRRITVLWETAVDRAKELDFSIDDVKAPLVSLFQERVSLITTDQQLHDARVAVVRLVTEMVAAARRIGFHAMNEFFLNQALFNIGRLPPFTN